MKNLMSRLAILAIVLISILSLVPLQHLKFDFNLEQFFPAGDPDLDFYNLHKQRFNADIDDEYIFIGLTNNAGIFDSLFLNKVDTLTKFIYDMDSVLAVYSVTNSSYKIMRHGRLTSTPIIHYRQPALYKADSVKLFDSKGFRDFLISKDGRSVVISAYHATGLDDDAKKELLASIRGRMDELHFDKTYFTAKILVEQTYLHEIKANLRIFLTLSLIIVSIILLLFFRSLKAIFVPLLTILFSVSWTLALIAYFGYPIDFISSLLPPVLAVICLSDVIHIYAKFIEELRKGSKKIPALKTTFREIGKATFYTSLTTAIGFYSLSFSNIVPIRMFGIFAGTGVLLAFLIVIVFVFGVSINSSVPSIVSKHRYGDRWNAFLAGSFRLLIKNRMWVFAGTGLVVVISLVFMSRITINSSLLQGIPRDNPILEDYNFIETQFSGTRSFEMALSLQDSSYSFLDLEVIHEVDDISNFLRDSCHVGMLISHVSFIKSALQAYKDGRTDAYRVPDSEADVYYLCNQIMRSPWAGEFTRHMTLDKRYGRISGRLPDLTTKEFNALSEKFDHYLKTHNHVCLEYKLTGSSVLIDETTYSLPQNMVLGLIILFGVISVIVGFMFRSIKMVGIVLLTNIIPLMVTAAVMGALGVFLKADTSVIFAIAFGIVVDDSIHFISRVKIELSKGRTLIYSVKRAYLSTGKAMIMTTLLLLAGFLTLLFSSFSGTYYIGMLVSVCLAVAVIFDLTLLPLLMLLFYKGK